MRIDYRLFDFEHDDHRVLKELFAATYGSSRIFDRRWNWQYIGHYQRNRVKLTLAVDGERIVGMSAHFPGDILIDNHLQEAYYASDSMVHPDYRRKGIMDGLYRTCFETMPVLYAKGSHPNMYRLRLKLGFRPIEPSTYMLNLLKPIRWFFSRIRISPARDGGPLKNIRFNNISPVRRFGEEFDAFFRRVASQYRAVIYRDSAFMNWRYLAHPYKQYYPFYHHTAGNIDGLIVLRGERDRGYITDLIWDEQERSLPLKLLTFAGRIFTCAGYSSLYCWTTYRQLRKKLRRAGFFNRPNTPRLSIYAPEALYDLLTDGKHIYLADGNGDNEWV